jgi:CRP-like cAMP-binding protein
MGERNGYEPRAAERSTAPLAFDRGATVASWMGQQVATRRQRLAARAALPKVPPCPAGARNQLLRALAPEDHAWLVPHLTPVWLPARRTLYAPGRPVDDVYFLETGGVSIITRVDGGRTVEVATVGPEGLVGLSAVLDAAAAPSETVVQVDAIGFRARATVLAAGFAERPGLRRLLTRYAQVYLTQVGQTAACSTVHSVAERCARWLLMAHDRAPGDEFALTHGFLALMLGVRRAGVSLAAEALQEAGAIRTRRGQVTVVDRARLEGAACACYGVVRREFDRLVGGGTPTG